VLKKKNKKKHFTEHRTYANRRLKAHPQSPNGGRSAEVQPFCATKKKPRSSVKQKEIK
jgi:hypothetical protein